MKSKRQGRTRPAVTPNRCVQLLDALEAAILHRLNTDPRVGQSTPDYYASACEDLLKDVRDRRAKERGHSR
jgi:hypothetical protein